MPGIFRYMGDVIKHRDLLVKLILKNLRVRYRYLFLGFLWAFLVPLFMVIIFKLVFSVILRVEVKDYPFFIYLMTAIFPWRYFQESISQATTSILDNKNLLKELAFPYELIPISVVFANLINFIPALGIMLIFLYLFRVDISPFLFFLPAVVLLHTLFITGISLIASCVYVRFRDIKHIVEILLMGLFYLTPVFYPLRLVANYFPNLFFNIYLFNPFVGILNLYRYSLLSSFANTLPRQVNLLNTLWLPLGICILVFLGGFYIFGKNKAHFNDYLST